MLQAVQTGFAVSATLELNIYMTPEDLISEFQPPPPLFNLYAIFIHHPAHSTQSLKFMKEIRGGGVKTFKGKQGSCFKNKEQIILVRAEVLQQFQQGTYGYQQLCFKQGQHLGSLETPSKGSCKGEVPSDNCSDLQRLGNLQKMLGIQ